MGLYSKITNAKESDVYVLNNATNVPPVLPNTSGSILTVITVITLVIGAAIIVTTIARQIAKKHYSA
jgi:hypothetical protein